ncbi:serine acetyltransferase [Rhodococcus sp. JG-3]|uniref:serine O-acetyltransferase n=1 Tax=Rhodococcus sp. JG-3 TaxID=1305835 RepID=UPI0012683C71|nr:serine acetyltransferase [Rhodococcus sp. JG-3]
MVDNWLQKERSHFGMASGLALNLRQDVKRYTSKSDVGLFGLVRILLVHPGARSSFLLRLQENSPLSRFGIFKSFTRSVNLFLTGADFVPGCVIGPGLMMQHPNGIVVGSKVIAGAKLTVLQQVTIGESIGSDGDLSNPVIGDEVVLGAGSRVLGGVKIGNRVKVGANAVVLMDIPDFASAVGIPARIVGISGA